MKKNETPDLKRLEENEHRIARAAWEVYVNSPARGVAQAFSQAEEFALAAKTRLSAILEKSAASEDDAAKKAADLDAAVERGDFTGAKK